MTPVFDATSTTDQVLAGLDLKSVRILVTGVSSGIGIETARALVAHGATVVGTARNLSKAHEATEAVQAATHAGGTFELVELDLASLSSVHACADTLLATGKPFDVLIFNAGVMACPYQLTEDGFEMHLATNHLGHFLLFNRLTPLLRPGSRVVSLASAGHRFANIDLDDPQFERTPYDPFTAYGRSKTANILFAVELDRRFKREGVRAIAVHPGTIQTDLGRHLPDGGFQHMLDHTNASLAAQGRPAFVPKTIPQGAATSVWAAVVAAPDEIGGRYCENCHVTAEPTLEPLDPATEGVRPYALDAEQAALLWTKSQQWVSGKG